MKIADALQPYAEFYFMDDKTHQQVAPSALFKDFEPDRSLWNRQLPGQLRQSAIERPGASILCSPTQRSYVAANPGQACIFQAGSTGV